MCSGDGESLCSCGILWWEGMCAVVTVKLYIVVEYCGGRVCVQW